MLVAFLFLSKEIEERCNMQDLIRQMADAILKKPEDRCNIIDDRL